MWVKMTRQYLAGICTGVGLAIFMLALAAQSDLLAPARLLDSGMLVLGLIILLIGGLLKWRTQHLHHRKS